MLKILKINCDPDTSRINEVFIAYKFFFYEEERMECYFILVAFNER
jgi:hypothetical protein